VSRLRAEMEKASEEMQYEQAASLRDQIRAIEAVVERQKIISNDYIDSDVLALARSDGDAVAQVFFIRGGKLIGRDYFLLEGAEENSDADVLAGFIKQFYSQASVVPPQVLLPHEVEEAQIIRQWLNQRRGDQKVEFVVPHQGVQQELIDMAVENASETLRALQAQWRADRHRQEQALSELQAALGLDQPLGRIECYDISNIQGTAAVGSMVVFEQGVPRKNLYRRFNIRSVSGPDDFASMEEVLTRRFNRWKAAQEQAETPGKKPDQAFLRLPDFLIVDGGKGQLGRAVAVLEKFGLSGKFPVAGLAKQNEELFFPDKALPLVLPRQSQALFLIQRIRDEAHRFAITSHRQQRTKAGLASRLEKVPGIGPKRRKALLERFGSIDGILGASPEELVLVNGITPALAQTIKEVLE
ncbi:MAG: excinuclease ABC subunit UvrC, partial [Anaerolineales bacterium]|nr:excinuclease ABC subunit UvrC [Anaerolineales bacterium]